MRFLVLLIFGLYTIAPALAFQDKANVAQINGVPISKAEFLYAFQKNQKENTPIVYDSLQKYLTQYIDFKLKVLAAEKAGIDASQTFKDEYNGYIAQIKKPYFQNPVSEESLILEVYNRLKYEVNASHILIRITNESNPMDTLAAYQKTDSLRTLAEDGADFALLAKNNSQDGSAKDGGSLGWFTAMAMVYPFENGAYETPVGGISKIIRSQFGYHIIKTNDKRPAKGRVKTSHIFLTKNGRSRESGNQLIQTIYDSIQNGGDWKVLCKQYTDDSQTQLNGGSLPFVGTGELPDEFLKAAYSIETLGDIAPPLEASYGWHIIRLDAVEQMPSLEELRPKISENIRRSGRNQLSQEMLVNKLKHENGFEQDLPRLQNTIAQIAAVGLPNIDLANLATQAIFKIGGKEVPYSDFFNSLGNANQITLTSVWNRYKLFEREQIILHEDSLAPQKYPEYGFLLNEYKEGLMLFEVMEKEVWNKAVEDSIGLNTFFNTNKKNYAAPERASVWVIESANSENLDKMLSTFKWDKNMSFENALKAQLDPQVFSALKIAKRTYQREDLPNFAQNWKEQALFSQPTEKRVYAIEEIIPKGIYRLEEIKGLVMADYQDWLEKDWIKSLRKANKIEIDTKVLKQIASDEKGKYYILLITLLAASSCEFLGMESEGNVDNTENLVARVGNTFLYKTDISDLTDASISSEDSARITERFIDNWIKKELFVREASSNSKIDQTEIQRKVEAYRYTLISYEYQKLMVEQQLSREVSEEEIRQYYGDNIENFQLRQNILRGRYLKILQAAQKKADVRRWMKSDRPEDLESLKSYGFQFASDFSLQDSTWINFDDLIKNSPFSTIENKIQFLRRNRYVEESDSLYLYLFRIHEFKLSEQVSPLEYVKEDIKNIIINKRKVEIAKSLENKVYERAKRNEDYEIYK